jgi:hypothetical protein
MVAAGSIEQTPVVYDSLLAPLENLRLLNSFFLFCLRLCLDFASLHPDEAIERSGALGDDPPNEPLS